MFRRVLGALAAAGVTLLSWAAVSQPGSSGAPAPSRSDNLLAPVFRSGFFPAPEGSGGRYAVQHRRASALFTDTGLSVRLPSRVQESRELGWSVAGGRAVKPRAEKPRAAKLHRMVGPSEPWGQELPTYGGLRYPGVLPGVDLWFEERAEGLEYGFRAERGEDLRRVRLEYAGAEAVRVVEEGRALEVDLGEGVLREEGLWCAQETVDGSLRAVGCRFADVRPRGLGRWEYAIEVDVEDPSRPVVVDPLVLWDTYLGGTGGTNELWGITQNDAGQVLVVGTMGGSLRAPPPDAGTTVGEPDSNTDVLVAKFENDGGLLWATQFGGAGVDTGEALFLGAQGELYVVGSTSSEAFQWTWSDGGTGSSMSLSPGKLDGFVARLDSSGSRLDWVSRFGGNDVDEVHAALLLPSGKLFIAGQTRSTNIQNIKDSEGPLVVAPEAFVTRVDLAGPSVDWTVLIQGAGADSAEALVENAGVLYVAGTCDFCTPTDDLIGPTKAFVIPILDVGTENPSRGSTVSMGGDYGSSAARALTLSATKDVVVWGDTWDPQFLDAGTFQGESDIFAAIFSTDAMGGGLKLIQANLFGGSKADMLHAVEKSASGQLFLGGRTFSADFPVPGGFDTSLGGEVDGFVARVDLDVEPPVQWASFVGGGETDRVYAVWSDPEKPARLLLGGNTSSQDLRYVDGGYPPRPPSAGTSDMFLLSVDLDATPSDAGSGEPDGGAPDAGTDGGTDAGTGGGQDAGTDGGTGPGGDKSPLGWSCATSGGPGALGLGALVGLMLLAARRRRTA